MEPTTNNPLNTWISEYHTRLAAIGQAVEALAAHLRRLPDPQCTEDVRELLHFREAQFRLDDSPADRGTRERVAATVAGTVLTDAQRRVGEALAKMLENIENVLAYDARHNRHGLFAPDELPPEAVRIIEGNVQLVNRRALPPDHSLREVPENDRLSWLWVAHGSIGFRQDGTPVRVLPQWATLASVRRVAAEQAAEVAKQERLEAELRQRQQEEEQRRRLRDMTDEQRLEERLKHLEETHAHAHG